MKIVVGLGNPGRQYEATRHNVGFDVVRELAGRWQSDKAQVKFQAEIREAFRGGQKILLVTPQTYMNRSGEAVQQIAAFWKVVPEDIAVVCDDLNLPLGVLRWRAEGSSGGQKGLSDILVRLGTERVPRLRMGIGRPPGQMDAATWVLARFRDHEVSEAERMTKRAADSVETWIDRGITEAMNRYNGAPEQGSER